MKLSCLRNDNFIFRSFYIDKQTAQFCNSSSWKHMILLSENLIIWLDRRNILFLLSLNRLKCAKTFLVFLGLLNFIMWYSFVMSFLFVYNVNSKFKKHVSFGSATLLLLKHSLYFVSQLELQNFQLHKEIQHVYLILFFAKIQKFLQTFFRDVKNLVL